MSGASWNPSRLRPMPEDFREIAPTLCIREAKARWAAGSGALIRWCAEANVQFAVKQGGYPPRPAPQDFREITGLTQKQACTRWGVGMATIRRWQKETGFRAIYVTPGAPLVPAPADLRIKAPSMTLGQLCDHYQVGDDRMKRWLRETGVTYKRTEGGPWGTPRQALLPQVDDSLPGRAAHFLRRWGPVYRADVVKKGAKGYILFGRQVSNDDLIEKARAKGFEPVAWDMAA